MAEELTPSITMLNPLRASEPGTIHALRQRKAQANGERFRAVFKRLWTDPATNGEDLARPSHAAGGHPANTPNGLAEQMQQATSRATQLVLSQRAQQPPRQAMGTAARMLRNVLTQAVPYATGRLRADNALWLRSDVKR